MTAEDLRRLYDYGYWANRKLLEVVAQLSAEEFTRPLAGSYGSVRDTMVHMLSAEWGWLDRCGGPARGPALKPADFPTLASLVQQWDQVEGYVRGFLGTLRDADLQRTVEFALGGGARHAMTLGHLMQHAANHGVHHRGQVALLLRTLGHAPGNVDLLFYDAGRQSSHDQHRD